MGDALLNLQAFPNAAGSAARGSDPRRAERAVAGPISVPGDLAERHQWVLWRYETRDGKPTKVPYQINGRRASSTDSATWVGFRQAKECLSRSNEYDGIGFVFSSMDPYCGLDLDDCMTCTADIKAWAEPILAAFGDTYMEISPSGKGVKIFARASLSGDGKRVYVDALGKPTSKDKSDGAIEIYDRGRYFTVTGDPLNGAPLQIEDHQGDVNALYALIFGANGEKPKAKVNLHTQPKFSEGERHDYLISLAAQFREKGMERPEILAAVASINNERCSPPKGLDEVAKIVHWVCQKPAGPGRGIAASANQPAEDDKPRPEHLPSIYFNNRQLRDYSDESLAALQAANDPPVLFIRSGRMVAVIRDEKQRHVIGEVSDSALRGRMSRCANFFKHSAKGHPVEYPPPNDSVEDTLLSQRYGSFRHLTG